MVVTSTTKQSHYQLSSNTRAADPLIADAPRGFKVGEPSAQHHDAYALRETAEIAEARLERHVLHLLLCAQDMHAAFRHDAAVTLHVLGDTPKVSHSTERSIISVVKFNRARIKQREVSGFEK